jgi:hypothetical protein
MSNLSEASTRQLVQEICKRQEAKEGAFLVAIWSLEDHDWFFAHNMVLDSLQELWEEIVDHHSEYGEDADEWGNVKFDDDGEDWGI